MNVEQHVLYALRNAIVKQWPFPHFFVENVFPAPFYAELLEHITQKQDYIDNTRSNHYANRSFAENSEIPGLEFMKSHAFLSHILAIFRAEVAVLQQKLGIEHKMQVYRDIRLIRDGIGYKIGPHTDAQWKMVSLLFYLPETEVFADYGTSLYVPKDSFVICEGGPHYPFEPFEKVTTVPFVPNSCLGFWKTNKSFHGVAPIPVSFNRDVLLYNIYQSKAFDALHSSDQKE